MQFLPYQAERSSLLKEICSQASGKDRFPMFHGNNRTHIYQRTKTQKFFPIVQGMHKVWMNGYTNLFYWVKKQKFKNSAQDVDGKQWIDTMPY